MQYVLLLLAALAILIVGFAAGRIWRMRRRWSIVLLATGFLLAFYVYMQGGHAAALAAQVVAEVCNGK